MSVVAAALRELMALGVSGEALIAAVQRIEDAATVERVASLGEAVRLASSAEDAKLAARKAKAAARTRKWRETPDAQTSVTVTSPTVTARHGDGQGAPATPSRTQVEDTSSSSLRSEEVIPPVTSKEVTAPKGAERNGTRLPLDWTPDEDGWTYASNLLGIDVDPQNELDRFRDYWRAVPGAKGRKADWPATWRNWIRRASETLPRKAHERPGQPSAKLLARHANYARSAEGARRVVEANRRARGDGAAADPLGEDWTP